MEKILTKQDVAKYLKVSTKTVDRMINHKTNKLKSFKINNGTVRIKESDFNEFIKKHYQ